MNEMLGNHYFLARNYGRAASLLSDVLRSDPKNKAIRRKLIICYSQIGRVDEAMRLFLSLIKDDIDFIINTDPIDDDCPCPEIVFNMEHERTHNQSSLDYLLNLGMLWLYCDLTKSVFYFKKAASMEKEDPRIKSILTLLSASLEKDRENV